MVDMCLEKLMIKLECAIKSAIEWFCCNGMKLNGSKCHLLICGHKFESMICKIKDALVIETHLVKLLGIKIELQLTFNNHLQIVCKKASQKLYALSRLCAISTPENWQERSEHSRIVPTNSEGQEQ